ncbi:HAUS augmin-like complex subunit 4, partial [Stegodyphus mimosarum]
MDNFKNQISQFEDGSQNQKFFMKVIEKLGPNLICKSLEKEKILTHSTLNESVQRYFKLHIIMNAVEKSVDNTDWPFHKNESINAKTVDISSDSLYLNAIKRYMHKEEETSRLKPLGLSQECASTIIENRKKSEAESLKFCEVVESDIDDFCMKVTKFVGQSVSSSDWKNNFNNTIEYLNSIATDLNPDVIKSYCTQDKEMLFLYYKVLSEGLSLLNQLFHLYEEKINFKSDVSRSLLVKCQALLLKIRTFELEILTATYNDETMPALRKISGELYLKEKKLEEERVDKTSTLESYEALGPTYEALVKKYTELLVDIKNQKWAIETLGQGQATAESQ